jgi:hypothetical protein
MIAMDTVQRQTQIFWLLFKGLNRNYSNAASVLFRLGSESGFGSPERTLRYVRKAKHEKGLSDLPLTRQSLIGGVAFGGQLTQVVQKWRGV